MPRRPRLFVAGGIYHVYCKTHRGELRFHDPKESASFVDTVSDVARTHQLTILAWCLMSNHYHLVVKTSDVKLWRTMARIHGNITRDHKRRHRVCGSGWQGRYRARYIKNDDDLRHLLAYVHLNPVTAGLADDLAPELEVIGTVAVAPAVDLIGWPPAAIGTIEQGYIAAIVAGFAEAYHLDVAEVLTAEGIELLDEVTTRCADPTTWTVALRSGSSVFHTDPSTLEPWSGLLTENSPELRTIDSPVLLVLGDQDRLWDIDLLDVIQDRMCGASTPVAVSIHIGEDHLSVSGAARGTIFSFIQDRLDGEPFEPDC